MIYLYLQIILILFLIHSLLILSLILIVLLFRKFLKKTNFKKELKRLVPFYLILSTSSIIGSFLWDSFIEGKGRDKLFYYWDHIPLAGFTLWTHDRPATRTLDKDLTPGVNLFTLDLIWLGMVLLVYSLSLFITWYLFWQKDPNSLKSAALITLVLLLFGLIFGFNQLGLVL